MERVELKGVPELMKRLEGLKEETRLKGGRAALRRAAQVVSRVAKTNALALDDPKSAEDIAKNITERWSSRRFKATGDLMMRVGVRGGAGGSKTSEQLAGLPGRDTRHWRYLEFGSENNAAQPLLRDAMQRTMQQATDTFIIEYGKSITRLMRAAQRKGTTA